MNTKNTENQPKSKQPSLNKDKILEPADYEKLRVIVTGLSHVDNAHWNKSGGPDMNYIKEAMGMVITADHMKAAGVGDWTRQTAVKLSDDKTDREAKKNEPPEEATEPESVDDADSGTDDSEDVPETPLEREERERQEARAMQRDNDQERANKHNETAAKIRAQIAAQEKADEKHEKDLAEKKKRQKSDDVGADLERQRRVAVDMAAEWPEETDPGAAIIDMVDRVYKLECLVLTLSNILLETPMTHVHRGKLANCVALLDPSSVDD